MILFTSDLLFGSKILGAARHAGLRGQGVRTRAALASHADGASHYFVDLEATLNEGETPIDLLDAALGRPHLTVVAFAGHTQRPLLEEATRRLAADGARHTVYSRGGLDRALVEILPPAKAPSAPEPGR